MIRRSFPAVLALCLFVAFAIACAPADTGEEPAAPAAEEANTGDASIVFEVSTTEHAFTAPPEIPSGWTNVLLRNDGEEAHFLNLWRLPEGKEFADYTRDVAAAFAVVGPYRAGEIDRDEMLGQLVASLPDWYDPIAMGIGGAGMTSPGHSVETWVRLEPGEYVMECYVQTPEGEFHNALGMMRPLIVMAEDSGLEPPAADVEIILSNYEITIRGELNAGEHTFAVRVAENPEGFLGHDLHLARLTEDADLEEIARWMDWVDALRTPAPVEFLGGVEQMPAGHTAYFSATLEPGRYAWISEAYAQRGMLREFNVR